MRNLGTLLFCKYGINLIVIRMRNFVTIGANGSRLLIRIYSLILSISTTVNGS
nr:MAG TPA: hypothetical protein [Caudoviricetes sp.]